MNKGNKFSSVAYLQPVSLLSHFKLSHADIDMFTEGAWGVTPQICLKLQESWSRSRSCCKKVDRSVFHDLLLVAVVGQVVKTPLLQKVPLCISDCGYDQGRRANSKRKEEDEAPGERSQQKTFMV